MKFMRVRKGVSWQKLGDEGIILSPSEEVLIGLTEKGWQLWKEIIENHVRAISEDAKVFVRVLKKMGILESNTDMEYSDDLTSLFIKWVEEYKPLAFTRSCGLYPAGGAQCDAYPNC